MSVPFSVSVSSADVRTKLVETLELDLIGPRRGLGDCGELLAQAPSKWYLTGFLVPRDAAPEQRRDPDAEDEVDGTPDRQGDDDDTTPERTTARERYLPSSMGLSLLIPATVSRISVTVRWGDYTRKVMGGAETWQRYERIAAEMPSLRALLRFKRMALVLDESHRIKTPTAKVTTAIQALRHDAARRFIMTGTPVANKPEDLWAQYFFLDDGDSLGATFTEFQARFGTTQSGYTRLDELRERIDRLSLRRPKEGTIDLPSKTITRVPVTLRGAQRDMYEELRTTLALWIQDLTGEEILAQAENILTRLIRLAQLASNPGLLDARYKETPAKFAALDDLLTTTLAAPSAKVIVWTSFVGNIVALQQRYPAYDPVTLHGEMDGAARQRAVREFKTNPAVRLLIANPAAAREGLTLTQANTAIYVDRTFNLVDFLQSQDRIHRLSQTQACEIILIVAENSIDEFVDFSIAQKHRLARYTQSDTNDISPEDLALQKPDLLRALVTAPGHT